MTDLVNLESIDYPDLLSLTISVIDNARIAVARQVNTTSITVYYEID